MKEITKRKISIEELRNEVRPQETTKPKLKSLSSNKIFKDYHGYSKRTKRNINKHILSDLIIEHKVITPLLIEKYKEFRRKRKKAEKAAQQDKHFKSVVYRRTHKKVKGKQQNQSKKKKEGE